MQKNQHVWKKYRKHARYIDRDWGVAVALYTVFLAKQWPFRSGQFALDFFGQLQVHSSLLVVGLFAKTCLLWLLTMVLMFSMQE